MPKAKKMSSDTRNFILGVGSSIVATIVWELIPVHNQYKLAQLAGNPLAVAEHYHFGLVSLIIAPHAKGVKPYLVGVGGGLIASEATQENPFGVGKPTFGASTTLGMFLTALLVLSYA